MIPKYKIGDLVVLRSNSPRIKIVNDKLGIDKNNFNCFNGMYECLLSVCGREGRFIFSEEDIELCKIGSDFQMSMTIPGSKVL